MTNLEAKQELARHLGADYTEIAAGNNDLITTADLQAWIDIGVLRAWDYKPWPFTLKTRKLTTTDTDYYDQDDKMMPGSVFKLSVGGEEFEPPLAFQDYLKYKEDNPTGTDKKWAMHETYIFVNKLSYTVGDEMCITGKKLAPKLTADADLLPFSPMADNSEHSGNGAIVTLGYAEALGSEKYKRIPDASVQEKKGYFVLDALWRPFAEQKSLSQSSRQMFDAPDYFATGSRSSETKIGNF